MNSTSQQIDAHIKRAISIFEGLPNYMNRPLTAEAIELTQKLVRSYFSRDAFFVRLAEVVADYVSWGETARMIKDAAKEHSNWAMFEPQEKDSHPFCDFLGQMARLQSLEWECYRGFDPFLHQIVPEGQQFPLPAGIAEMENELVQALDLLRPELKDDNSRPHCKYIYVKTVPEIVLGLTLSTLESPFHYGVWHSYLQQLVRLYLKPVHIEYLLKRKLSHSLTMACPEIQKSATLIVQGIVTEFAKLKGDKAWRYSGNALDRLFLPNFSSLENWGLGDRIRFAGTSREALLSRRNFSYGEFHELLNSPRWYSDKKLMIHVLNCFPSRRYYSPENQPEIHDQQFEFLQLSLSDVKAALEQHCQKHQIPWDYIRAQFQVTTVMINAAHELARLNYDLVVCVCDSGTPLGALLEMRGAPVWYLGYDKESGEPPAWLHVGSPKRFPTKPQRVLVVDSDSVTGTTLRAIVPLLEELKPGQVDVVFAGDPLGVNQKNVQAITFYNRCLSNDLTNFKNRNLLWRMAEFCSGTSKFLTA